MHTAFLAHDCLQQAGMPRPPLPAEFSMADEAGSSSGAAGTQPFAGLPPQDGHYHFDDKARI